MCTSCCIFAGVLFSSGGIGCCCMRLDSVYIFGLVFLYTQPRHHEQDLIQSLFLSGVKLVSIKSFPLHKLLCSDRVLIRPLTILIFFLFCRSRVNFVICWIMWHERFFHWKPELLIWTDPPKLVAYQR